METYAPFVISAFSGVFVGFITCLFFAGGKNEKLNSMDKTLTALKGNIDTVATRVDTNEEKIALFRESVPRIYATKENVNDAESRLGKNMDRVMDKLDNVIDGMGVIKNQLIDVLARNAK